MKEVYEFLNEAGTFFLATTEGNQPRVRPFGVVNICDNKLYIQTGRRKNVSKQILANPKVEICAVKDGKWIRISGILIDDNRVGAKKSMLDAHSELRKIGYDENDENTEVLYFKDATATISSFTEADKVIKF